MGVSNSHEEIFKKLTESVRAGYGEYTPFYWNTGENRNYKGPKAFMRSSPASEAHTVQHYLTQIQRYKLDASIIGVKYFRAAHEEASRAVSASR
jgi:hypothetical protein